VVNGEAKKFGGDRMSFNMIKKGEGGDKKVKFRALVVLDSKVIYHQGKDDVTRDVTEETGGGGLVEAVRGKMGEETGLFETLACLLKSVHRLIDAEKEVGFAGGVVFDEGYEVEVGEDRVGEKMGRDFDKLGMGKGRAKC
jgi:hypothetical protein